MGGSYHPRVPWKIGLTMDQPRWREPANGDNARLKTGGDGAVSPVGSHLSQPSASRRRADPGSPLSPLHIPTDRHNEVPVERRHSLLPRPFRHQHCQSPPGTVRIVPRGQSAYGIGVFSGTGYLTWPVLQVLASCI